MPPPPHPAPAEPRRQPPPGSAPRNRGMNRRHRSRDRGLRAATASAGPSAVLLWPLEDVRMFRVRFETLQPVVPERLAQPAALPRSRAIDGLLSVVGQFLQHSRDVVEAAVRIDERLQVSNPLLWPLHGDGDEVR